MLKMTWCVPITHSVLAVLRKCWAIRSYWRLIKVLPEAHRANRVTTPYRAPLPGAYEWRRYPRGTFRVDNCGLTPHKLEGAPLGLTQTSANSTSGAPRSTWRGIRAGVCFTDLCRGEDLPPVPRAFCAGAFSASRATVLEREERRKAFSAI